MKALVKENFNDRYTGELYKAGQILEITDERFAEILDVAPLVEAVPENTGDNGENQEQETPVDEHAPEQEAEPETKTKKGRK